MKVRVGKTATVRRRIRKDVVAAFGDVLGNRDPSHLDGGSAKASRFGGRIAQGVLGTSLIPSVIGNRLPGPGTIYLSQTLRILAPVYLGDTVIAENSNHRDPGGQSLLTLEASCVNQRQETVVADEAGVLLGSHRASQGE